MAGTDRLAIFPSRANQVQMKQRIVAAQRGMMLMKRKRDAIDLKLRELRTMMQLKEEEVDSSMRAAIFSLAKANLVGTDFKPTIVADSHVATTYMVKRQQKIVGVTLNYFELVAGAGSFPMTGLSVGGHSVQEVRRLFQEALQQLVQYASLEYMVRMLTHASRQTNMRVNALDHVVIPRFINTHAYICGELDEFEREDFYRLKRSQAKQKQAKVAFSELIKTKNMPVGERSEYIKRSTSILLPHPVADVHFEISDFDEATVEDRQRYARYQRHMKRKQERRAARARGDLLLAQESSFVKSLSMVDFLHKKQKMQDGSDDSLTEKSFKGAASSKKPGRRIQKSQSFDSMVSNFSESSAESEIKEIETSEELDVEMSFEVTHEKYKSRPSGYEPDKNPGNKK